MKDLYFQSVIMIERLHRLFLELIRTELDRIDVRDINSVQSLVLYNVGKGQVTVGELTNRGYYLGSNVSYNLQKMVQQGYLLQEASVHDRRSSHVRLSEKGLELYDKLDALIQSQSTALEATGVTHDRIESLGKTLSALELFWHTSIKTERR